MRPHRTFTRRAFLQTATGAGSVMLAGCDSRILGGAKPGDFTPPSTNKVDAISHAINRLSWGQVPGEYQRVSQLGKSPEAAVAAYVEEQLSPHLLNDSRAMSMVASLDTVSQPRSEIYSCNSRQIHFELTRATLLSALVSPCQLREVMVGFWTDHFNIDSSKLECRWLKCLDDREVIRRHALGKFPELLRASALSPAMLWYLDGQSSVKEKPNENYARELLELHTLGIRGGYTQTDVMEAARCLTGWTARAGRVKFHAELHDQAAKIVLGRALPAGQGHKDLDSLLEIVASHPATARHLATKLCRRFIADNPPETAIAAVAKSYQATSGDICTMLRTLFSTEDFRNSAGQKLKRPSHFLLSALRGLGAASKCGKNIHYYLRRMGHMPFDYPTPEGYADQSLPWHSTLLARWDFALRLTSGSLADSQADLGSLAKAAGGAEGLASHLLGRAPSEAEKASFAKIPEIENRTALILASPGFQIF